MKKESWVTRNVDCELCSKALSAVRLFVIQGLSRNLPDGRLVIPIEAIPALRPEGQLLFCSCMIQAKKDMKQDIERS